MITSFVVTILMLAVLIFVHELGHFLAAKSVDIEVQKFSIGFGPKIFGFQKGETEYLLSLIPLGGYVSMGGMYDETMEQIEGGSKEDRREPSDRDFDSKPIWARAFVLSAGVLMNFLLAFLIYTGVAAFWGTTKIEETRVAQVDSSILPSGAENLSLLESGTRLVTIGDRVVNYWGDVGKGFLESPAGHLEISTESPQAVIAIDLPESREERMVIIQSLSMWQDNIIGVVNPDSPAETGGLQDGDKVTEINGVKVSHWYDMTDLVRSSPDLQLEFSLERDGRRLVRFITPEAVFDGDSEIGLIGVSSSIPYTSESVGLIGSLEAGFRETVVYSGMIVGFVRQLFTGGVSPRELGSVFAIGEMAGQTARLGLEPYLRFVALFSINLAILNLLPIPVLDGGHLMFLGVEAIRRKPLSLATKLRFSQVGLFVLVAIMILALSNDFRRMLGF